MMTRNWTAFAAVPQMVIMKKKWKNFEKSCTQEDGGSPDGAVAGNYVGVELPDELKDELFLIRVGERYFKNRPHIKVTKPPFE